MKTILKSRLIAGSFGAAFLCAIGATAAERGFNFGNLNVSPYLKLEARYDTNVDSDNDEYKDTIFTVIPGLDLRYTGNDWGFDGAAFYAYDWYNKYDELDGDRWSERIRVWKEHNRFKLIFGEQFTRTRQADSLLDTPDHGGLWRDRWYFNAYGIAKYQFSDKFSAQLDLTYSNIDYHNDEKSYYPLYGWEEWSVGLELARKLTEKTNFLLRGGVQFYESDRTGDIRYNADSTAYSLQAGIGSRATERITYRALTGLSAFDFGNEDMKYGWIYTVDLNWIISRKLAFTAMGSSYFQPSEDRANNADLVYTFSIGATYRPVKKVLLRADLAYRSHDEQYSNGYGTSFDYDNFSGRLRFDYFFMRHVSLYGSVQYDYRISDYEYYDYDRFLGLIGVMFRY